MIFLTALLSKTGGRLANEDHCDFAQLEKAGCWVIADGLGGHQGGAVASKNAVDAVIKSFRENPVCSKSDLYSHMENAQNTLLQKQEEDTSLSSMRTTLTVLLTDGNSALWGHIGDSRLYLFREGRVLFQTKDHSVPQSLVNSGQITPAEIRQHEDRNRLLRALGQNGAFRPGIYPTNESLQTGDAFLLCTDGFWELVIEEDMLSLLALSSSPEIWLAKLEECLLSRAMDEFDNYSAVAVFIK